MFCQHSQLVALHCLRMLLSLHSVLAVKNVIQPIQHQLQICLMQSTAPAVSTALPPPTSPGGTPIAGYITHHVPGSIYACFAFLTRYTTLTASIVICFWGPTIPALGADSLELDSSRDVIGEP